MSWPNRYAHKTKSRANVRTKSMKRHLLPGCHLTMCFVFRPTHLLPSDCLTCPKESCDLGTNLCLLPACQLTGLGLGWAPQRKKGEEEVVTAASEMFTIGQNESRMFG